MFSCTQAAMDRTIKVQDVFSRAMGRSPGGSEKFRDRTESSARLIRATKLSHTFPQALLRHRNCIVRVHRARGLRAVLLIQHDLRWYAANRGSDRRNRDRS